MSLISLWWRRARTRRALHELDDRLLADIGCTPAERRCECSQWFWQPDAALNDLVSSRWNRIRFMRWWDCAAAYLRLKL